MDLVILAADAPIEQALRGLLERPVALGIRAIQPKVNVHPRRDPGCFLTGHELLAPYAATVPHALVVFDRSWDGAPSSDPAALAEAVTRRLAVVWGERARAIVIDPEVDVWIWSDSPHVGRALGWAGDMAGLKRWLGTQGLWTSGESKPHDPKTAFHAAVKRARIPPSSAIFREIASKVSFGRCTDQAFRDLLTVLREWFPVQTP